MTSTKQPWKRLSSTVVYDNPWMRVEEHQVINPSGAQSLYGKVCFKNRAVAVLALDDADNIYLVGQHRYTLDEYAWELPMGGAPEDEDILFAAKRELKEETGISASSWTQVMRIHTSNCITDEVGFVFLARGLRHGEQDLEPTEDLTVRKLPLQTAMTWVLDGRITDAVSAAGILRLCVDRERLLSR